MDWKAQRPAIEIAAEWIATACVGGATAFAAWALAPATLALIAAPATGIAGAMAALFALGRVARRVPSPADGFVPVPFGIEEEAQARDKPVAADDCLLLDDPIPAVAEESRVVRLFAVPQAAEPAPLPAPGEMAARIEDFLGGSRPGPVAAAPPSFTPPATAPATADASAALHAALADIRRSLRQA
jgi:hypothetical protein